MSKKEVFIIEPSISLFRKTRLKRIISGREDIKYRLSCITPQSNPFDKLNSAVFIFPEFDNTFSIQTDNFQGRLLFPSWSAILEILRGNCELNELSQRFDLQKNFQKITESLIRCTIKSMPIGGLLFGGKNTEKPSSAYLYCHPKIPEEFVYRIIKERIEDQREIVRKLM